MWKLTALKVRLSMALRSIPGNDRGYSAEWIILTGLLATTGLVAGGIFHDDIIAAARDITFSD